mgnify:CR=1 FL=1
MKKILAFSLLSLTALGQSKPLVSHMFTADPSAHVFQGQIYIYPSHDIDAGVKEDDLGSHFAMEDYHILSMETPDSNVVVDHGVALHINDVAWASQQMWAPDAACKDGKYYLYFPAKNHDGLFQIGVAIGDHPEGPFTPEPAAIVGSYSIDPAVFKDDDGKYYMYFGGIWGGQLQSYRNNTYNSNHKEPENNEPALGPRVALLTDDMTQFASPVAEIIIIDENGVPLDVPPITPETEQEKAVFEGAERRREVRLVLAGKIKAHEAEALKKLFSQE